MFKWMARQEEGRLATSRQAKFMDIRKWNKITFMNFMRFCSLCSLCCRVEHDLSSRAQQARKISKNSLFRYLMKSFEISSSFFLVFFPRLQGSVLNWFWLRKNYAISNFDWNWLRAPNEMNSQLSTSLLVVISIFVLSHLTLPHSRDFAILECFFPLSTSRK